MLFSFQARAAARDASVRRVAKKLFIKTFGCQMNVYDSARMADALAPMGFVPAGLREDRGEDKVDVPLSKRRQADGAFTRIRAGDGQVAPQQGHVGKIQMSIDPFHSG